MEDLGVVVEVDVELEVVEVLGVEVEELSVEDEITEEVVVEVCSVLSTWVELLGFLLSMKIL